MNYNASTTKQRFCELQKNPLVFSKFGEFTIYENGNHKQYNGWISCDPTIEIKISENTLPKNKLERILFIKEENKAPLDEKKEENDTIFFQIREFNPSSEIDWILVFNDCQYNKNGNSQGYIYCHMKLFWALYTKQWNKNIVGRALLKVSREVANTVSLYVGSYIVIFSMKKQRILSELFKEYNPDIKPLMFPHVEEALRELQPQRDFDDFGCYHKIDYILNYGSQAGEYQQLQELYNTSNNLFIHFKFWISHSNHKFDNYNYLEEIFSYVDCSTQLSIIKRYLHDIRNKNTEVDYSLLEKMRDFRNYGVYANIRYFVTKPGDNKELTASLLCDALITLNREKGKRIQTFNGILDFLVKNGNVLCPSVDLGVKNILPICDGGLLLNNRFIGFVYYDTTYVFNVSLMTKEKLMGTIDFLLDYSTILLNHYCCGDDNDKELSENGVKKCEKLYTKNKGVESMGWQEKVKCDYLKNVPFTPKRWKSKGIGNANKVLNLFIDNVESKDYITEEDFNLSKLRQSLIDIYGKREFIFVNDMPPQNREGKSIFEHNPVSKHVFDNYYSPKRMKIYPNQELFFSSKESLIGAWELSDIPHNIREEGKDRIVLEKEAPVVYNLTFESLKTKYPEGEIGTNHIELPYDSRKLREIKNFYHYRPHDNNNINLWEKKFLAPKSNKVVFYCTPKLATLHERVSDLPFYICMGNECYHNVLINQALDRQPDWRKYTLYHAAEILGYPLIITTEDGNIPTEVVSNFATEVKQAEKFYPRLVCRSCGHLIFSRRRTSFDVSRYFQCENSLCPQYRNPIYLSYCSTCKKGLIDSRDCKQCENGWRICPDCLSCCNDNLFDRLVARHIRMYGNNVPERLQRNVGRGHNNKGIFFCPKCSKQLEEITKQNEKGADEKDLICPQCDKSYRIQHEKYLGAISLSSQY